MDRINRMIVEASLKQMLRQGYIAICTIRHNLEIAGVSPEEGRLKQLEALHCVEFQLMDRELVELIPQFLRELFRDETLLTTDANALTVPVTEARPRGPLLRLLNALDRRQ